MIEIQSYSIAILLSVTAMICWGSWANTQKMAAKTWRFELFYWDLVIGIFLMSLIAAFTVGSIGSQGRPFLTDLGQAEFSSIIFAMLGGILWNMGNILLVAAIAIAGMAIALPIGGGIAWILGIVINYILILVSGQSATERPMVLWIGVLIIVLAIVLAIISAIISAVILALLMIASCYCVTPLQQFVPGFISGGCRVSRLMLQPFPAEAIFITTINRIGQQGLKNIIQQHGNPVTSCPAGHNFLNHFLLLCG